MQKIQYFNPLLNEHIDEGFRGSIQRAVMPFSNIRVPFAERTEQASAFAREARLRFRNEESALAALAVRNSNGAVRLERNTF